MAFPTRKRLTITQLKRRLAAIVREEIKKENQYFENSCEILFNIVAKDDKIDACQRRERKKLGADQLWEMIYGPNIKKLEGIIKKINEVNEA